MTQEGSEEKQTEAKTIQVSFPLVMIRTKKGLDLMDRMGHTWFVRKFSWVFLFILPIAAAGAFYLIANSVSIYLSNALARGFAREVGPLANVLIPGVNPYVPILYGWLALVVALVVHEGAHGVVARSLGFPVKSTGLLLLLVIPIGAFAEVDEKMLKEGRARDAVRILAGGPGANILAAFTALLILIMIVSSMAPLASGVGITGVIKDYPAEEAGILPGDIIVQIGGKDVLTVADFQSSTKLLMPGDMLDLTVLHDGRATDYSILLAADPDNKSRGIIGFPPQGLVDIDGVLDNYLTLGFTSPLVYLVIPTFGPSQQFIPFSDTMHLFHSSSVGDIYFPLANMLYWIWFVNFNLAIFNALPIFPLDGGQAFKSALRVLSRNRVSEGRLSKITLAVTLAIVGLVISMIIIPYLG